MSVRIQFPKGSAFSFTRQFTNGGSPLDLTAATLVGYLKYSPDDADADAIASIAVAALVPASGTVAAALAAAASADLPRGVQYYFELRATIAGTVYIPEDCHGWVVLTPLDGVLATLLSDLGITETITPDDTPVVYTATGTGVINRPDITSLTGGLVTSLDYVPTLASTTYPVGTIVILSYGLVSQIWKLVAGTDAEDVSATPAVVRPDDFNASTNALVWKQIG